MLMVYIGVNKQNSFRAFNDFGQLVAGWGKIDDKSNQESIRFFLEEASGVLQEAESLRVLTKTLKEEVDDFLLPRLTTLLRLRQKSPMERRRLLEKMDEEAEFDTDVLVVQAKAKRFMFLKRMSEELQEITREHGDGLGPCPEDDSDYPL